MLEDKPVQSAIGRGARAGQERCMSFTKCDDVLCVVQKVDEFAVAPDATLLDGAVIAAPLAPDPLQLVRIETVRSIGDFQQPAAFRAVIKHVSDGIS